MSRITEKELLLPTLYLLARSSTGLSTSDLISELTSIFKPNGEDAEILAGRKDTKFSQKVRNLKSHDTLTKDGLVEYKNKLFTITNKGKKYVKEHSEIIQYLLSDDFNYKDTKESFDKLSDGLKAYKKAFLYDENLIISEGQSSQVNIKKLERSSKLRQFAINKFTKDGKIKCKVCGFDFEENYGETGKGFIEIHHIKPIFSFTENDNEKTLKDALKNLVPLCSNCHRMIHKKPKHPITLNNLKKIFKLNRT